MSSVKTLGLIEQKRLQWAKEREEMLGLYGLWGRPRSTVNKNCEENENDRILLCSKSYMLPPIQGKNKFEEESVKKNFRPEEESETSGYLSDSPKHLNDNESSQDCRHLRSSNDAPLNNESVNNESGGQQCWNEADESETYWSNNKMYKNYKNENWAHQNTASHLYHNARVNYANKNYWHGTPESLSSDDGSRLRWGDRGVGIGHLWEPVINPPDCRLPQVIGSCRQTPKWVEKGLTNSDGNNADILIIHHPNDDQYEQPQKNYLLGQNVPIPPDVIEERELKRKKALEHQNAIKKQLEERELKRKQERENRIREEKLEEERIRKEQEIERLRYEEEQRKIKEKEEIEKKKEETMRKAIEAAEKQAREEKRQNKRHAIDNAYQKNIFPSREKVGKLEKILEQTEIGLNGKRYKTPKHKKMEETSIENHPETRTEANAKFLKDSSCQFEEIQLANSFQLLNVNGLPVDGGLALMLDNPPKDNNFLLTSDGVQLALLMSPRNSHSSTNRLIPLSPPVSGSCNPGERILTPSKYRITQRLRYNPSNKSTQTEFKYNSSSIEASGSAAKERKQSKRRGANGERSETSQKGTTHEKHHKHIRCFLSSKYHPKSRQSKISLEDRPKWGINRPSVQYKKQSEKDLYYQKKIRERRRIEKATATSSSSENTFRDKENSEVHEKELNFDVRLLNCESDGEEKGAETKEEILLQNGYRMNSNLSSPVFVPISNSQKSEWEGSKEAESETQRSRSNDSSQFELVENEDTNYDEEETEVVGSVGFLSKSQLEAIKQIANLREGLRKLQKDYSNSRSITPYSDKSSENKSSPDEKKKMIKLDDFLTKKKEPAQVLDLSKVKITSKEEFKKYAEKIPESKVKPEKILPENIKIKDKEFSFVSGKKEEKQVKEWSYLDPIPADMKGAKLEDLCPVNIDWKMLTTLRPKTKVEEDMFSRLVQLGKLHLKYQQSLLKEKSTNWIKKTKNPKSSILEMKVVSCKECSQDFCDGFMCSKLMYENFFRPLAAAPGLPQNLLSAIEAAGGKNKRKKKRKRRKSKKRRENKSGKRKLGKNSIFNRPASRGCNRDHSRRTTETIAAKARPIRALSSTRSFSTDRMQNRFYEGRSRSAPKIHFESDILDLKSTRFEYLSESGPSQTDYSSQSDSESPDYHQRFVVSRLRLSGRKKLLSARVGFEERNKRRNSAEVHGSRFSRKCASYKGYHSDTSVSNNRKNDASSRSSLSPRSRSISKSPKRTYSSFFAKHPSTIRIQFDDFFPPQGLRFPEKIFLLNKSASRSYRKKDVSFVKSQELIKVAEGLSKIKLEFNNDSIKNLKLLPRNPENCVHSSRSRMPKPCNYMKTRILKKKSD